LFFFSKCSQCKKKKSKQNTHKALEGVIRRPKMPSERTTKRQRERERERARTSGNYRKVVKKGRGKEK
jgi:hypothetical protein